MGIWVETEWCSWDGTEPKGYKQVPSLPQTWDEPAGTGEITYAPKLLTRLKLTWAFFRTPPTIKRDVLSIEGYRKILDSQKRDIANLQRERDVLAATLMDARLNIGKKKPEGDK